MEQVTIKIRTTQTVDGQQERMKTLAHGELTATDHTYVLTYDLTDDSGEVTHTTLTVDKAGKQAIMVGNGTMIIEPNRLHTAPYRMGPYEMELGVRGKAVLCRLTAKGGNLKLQYDLIINGTPVSENTVELFVES